MKYFELLIIVALLALISSVTCAVVDETLDQIIREVRKILNQENADYGLPKI